MSGPAGGRALVRRLAVGGLIALSVAVTACTSEAGTPGSLPTANDTAPASTTASSPATPSPSSSETSDDANVEAAVARFVQSVNVAISTGKADEYVHATSESCTCRQLVESVERRASRGQIVIGGEWIVKQVTPSEPSPAGNSVVVLEFTETAFEILDSSGQVVDSGDARTSKSLVVLAHRSGRWVVVDVDPTT